MRGKTEPDVVELYCRDCQRYQFSLDIDDYDVGHCVYCGGVNIDSSYEELHRYLERDYPSLSLVHQKFFDRQKEAWGIVKNLNTDDELEEIELLLNL